VVVPNPEDMRPWLERAAVFVSPIRDGGGTKLKILDALAMGKPVVSTRTGSEGLSVTSSEYEKRKVFHHRLQSPPRACLYASVICIFEHPVEVVKTAPLMVPDDDTNWSAHGRRNKPVPALPARAAEPLIV